MPVAATPDREIAKASGLGDASAALNWSARRQGRRDSDITSGYWFAGPSSSSRIALRPRITAVTAIAASMGAQRKTKLRATWHSTP